MGYGNKSDFTTDNVKDKGEPNYEFEKFGSITYQLRYNKSKSTKKNDTFYSTFRQNEKSVVPTCLRHYYGRATNYNGLGPEDLDTIQTRTMNSAAQVPRTSTDRGLKSWTSKQLNAAKVGPGAYTDETRSAFPHRASTSQVKAKTSTGFGTASRDTHFSKYNSLHHQLVTKGLN
jgi:hypothetical protein